MKTFLDNLFEKIDNVKMLFEELIIKHSNIYKCITKSRSPFIISVSGVYIFKELKPEGKRIQSKLNKEYTDLFNLISVLLNNQVKPTIDKFNKINNILMKVINQNGNTFYKTIKEMNKSVNDAFNDLKSLLEELYKHLEKQIYIIPDTNALIQNPDLEDWVFEKKPFTILLVPTVLSELDKLKIEHRNEEVRKKANSVINRIKGYRNRGSLFEGVNLRNGVSYLMSSAIEPNFTNTLNWLDENNNDDRFIASYFEIIRSYPDYNVSIVTGDINLQNKAEFALIPFYEPPKVKPLIAQSTPKSIKSKPSLKKKL